ncbi:response regulator [Rufibacter sp. LB8]|uniref:response regulator n=1 Tax=Rufibacter sp. LB8 TaxID=2777781 RepID=UPI00178C4A52|nr:response regulator [Rufibacter sp. LB8]
MDRLNCILLIDDDQSANFISQTVIKKLDCAEQVLVAQNGRQALDLIQEHCLTFTPQNCPQLILLDIKMPVMDGFEFLREFEDITWPTRQKPIVVLLTTSASPTDILQAQSYKLGGFLNKPLNKEKLNTLMETHFLQQPGELNYESAV